MKLKKVQVTNFRSVENSGEFAIDDLTTLVGKNEAGKSAILQALAGLNPHPSTPVSFNLERDYPRRFLTEYATRHQGEQAVVIRTWWSLADDERVALEADFGEGTITTKDFQIFRRYGANSAEFQTYPINYLKGVAHLLEKFHFGESDQEPIKSVTTSDGLREGLAAIETRTEAQNQLLAFMSSLPGKNLSGAISTKLRDFLPQFMYFSYYDHMVGQLRLDTFGARKDGQLQPPIEPGEQVYLDFLSYAGTSIAEITTAQTYEGLNARCEAASNRISEQILEYWTQNPHLEIVVTVTKAEAGDPPPFNEGVIARTRIRNNLHKLTLPFSERSAGFIWFFSFLVKFSQVQKEGKPLVLLLDEPGLTLHGKAQNDLIRYFTEKLIPHHQVIYSTHSPFMVPAERLELVRIIEDRVTSPRPGQWASEGTKVRSDILIIDPDTLFPLQGALGYEVCQSLFIGKNTLLVEGPGDVLYLHAWSAALGRRGRAKLDARWTICPAGGLDKIQPFVSLFSSAKLEVAALTDFAKSDRRKLEAIIDSRVLETGRLLTFAAILGLEEADIEDVFVPDLYAAIVNAAFGLTGTDEITSNKLAKEQSSPRLVKKVDAIMRLVKAQTVPGFDHYTPAEWLVRNSTILDGDLNEVVETLNRAEQVIVRLNRLLPQNV